MRHFEENFPLYVFGLLIVGVFAAATWLLVEDASQQQAFMADCEQHQRHYECVAMWRAGSTNKGY